MEYKSPIRSYSSRSHGHTPKKQININEVYTSVTSVVPPEYHDYLLMVIDKVYSERYELWEQHIEKLNEEIREIEENRYPFLNYELYSNPNYIEEAQSKIDQLIQKIIVNVEPGRGISKLTPEFKRQILYYFNLLAQPVKEETKELLNRINELYDEKQTLKKSNDVHIEAMLEEFIIDLAHRFNPISKISEFRKIIIPSLNPGYRKGQDT